MLDEVASMYVLQSAELHFHPLTLAAANSGRYTVDFPSRTAVATAVAEHSALQGVSREERPVIA